MPFIFDKESHRYTLDGRVLLSNTDILSSLGFSDYSSVPPVHLEMARLIGKDVHEATLLLDEGGDWKKKYSHVKGWVAAWQMFKKEFQFKPEIREQPMYDPLRLIATTPDAFGDSKYGLITVQIKTCEVEGKRGDWVGLQTAFEEWCIRWTIAANDSEDIRDALHSQFVASSAKRWAVELRNDGTYHPRKFDKPNDLKVFFAAATCASWMRSHK